MKNFYSVLFLLFLAVSAYANGAAGVADPDTTEVIRLNKQAYDTRLTNPEQSVISGTKALEIATKLGYTYGIAEANRQIGLGQYYSNQPTDAINSYTSALTVFQSLHNEHGIARVYNNMGNLYGGNDYKTSLNYFDMALAIGKKLSDRSIIATTYLNLGNFYVRSKSFNQALKYYHDSNSIFQSLSDSANLILCEQDLGVDYFNLHQYDMAEQLLTDANKKAKDRDLNETVASIDLTLATLYISQNKFDDATNTVTEGLAYAAIVKDEKLEHDLNYTNFQLEYKRHNYERALYYLCTVYLQDSVDKKTNLTSQLKLFQVTNDQLNEQKDNLFLRREKYYENVRFLGVTAVTVLLMIVVGLLVTSVKRKAKTNLQLTELNGEVSRQKDNLDRVNHHLEEIIDERTKDLQTKNRKLSDYSSYLSHQIRGPIATLKGLMNLEKEGLVDKQECINMMDKCVSEIDEKIIEMSDMMHDPGKVGF
jgi:tetratricopeptide (TPR) repeat protein